MNITLYSFVLRFNIRDLNIIVLKNLGLCHILRSLCLGMGTCTEKFVIGEGVCIRSLCLWKGACTENFIFEEGSCTETFVFGEGGVYQKFVFYGGGHVKKKLCLGKVCVLEVCVLGRGKCNEKFGDGGVCWEVCVREILDPPLATAKIPAQKMKLSLTSKTQKNMLGGLVKYLKYFKKKYVKKWFLHFTKGKDGCDPIKAVSMATAVYCWREGIRPDVESSILMLVIAIMKFFRNCHWIRWIPWI